MAAAAALHGEANEGSPSPAPAAAFPALNLPKGGGAIRGIGQKIEARPALGTAHVLVPLPASPGRGGFGPQLALSYQATAGNGPFGLGWKLEVPAITRKCDKGIPRYREGAAPDTYLLSGADDLVPARRPDGSAWSAVSADGAHVVERFRPRVEAAHARVERWTRSADGDVHWRTISAANVLTIYGAELRSRIADPADPARVFSWLASEQRDDKGNAMVFEYAAEDDAGVDTALPHERARVRGANRHLKRIRYGNRETALAADGDRPQWMPQQVSDGEWLFELVFDYGDHASPSPRADRTWPCRPDPFSTYRAGFEIRTLRLCQRVLMFHHFPDEPGVGPDCLVRETTFTYSAAPPEERIAAPYSRLAAIVHKGCRPAAEGGDTALPPLEFGYGELATDPTVRTIGGGGGQAPLHVDGKAWRWTDLDGEGLPGILSEQGSAWFYQRNQGPLMEKGRPGEHFRCPEGLPSHPNVSLRGAVGLMDLAGDGLPDVVVMQARGAGLYERNADRDGWTGFRAFPARPSGGLAGESLRLIDLDGDGQADLLVSEADAYVWHASLAEEGFGPAVRVAKSLDENRGPRVVFAGSGEAIHLADMSGDGLSDLVRVRNGEICYWPNLGFGNFGARVVMEGAPLLDHPDLFDPARVLIADLDGSGPSDLVYLHRDGARIYFNRSGNGWGSALSLGPAAAVRDVKSVATVDLFGNGTRCLVWSQPDAGEAALRYVDIAAGSKPLLLETMRDNLGTETRLHHAPSTRFYLRDRLAGRPWSTRLPFPVHVLAQVETRHGPARSVFITRYEYHDGYFDAQEREFRGFGSVEQVDSEWHDAMPLSGPLETARTRRWYHTGDAAAGDPRAPGRTRGAFAARSQVDAPLGPCAIDASLTAGEARQAHRALRGQLLREEIFAPAGTIPLLAREQRYAVRCLQRANAQEPAVFDWHALESLTVHYEQADEARVEHHLTLQVDGFGNVLREAQVAYGRQPGAGGPAGAAGQAAARRCLATCARRTFATGAGGAAVDTAAWWRTPQLASEKQVELASLAVLAPQARLGLDDVREATRDDALAVQPLCSETRRLYRSDDLTRVLPQGVLEARAVEHESYRLAFTQALLETLRKGAPAGAEGPMLAGGGADHGGYVDLDGDGQLWIPSGQVRFGDAAVAGDELSQAVAGFFLPRRFLSPFEAPGFRTESTVTYDRHALLLAHTRDALGNVHSAGERRDDGSVDPGRPANDYRVLQPVCITDPNGNRMAARYDALGRLEATAVMGKASGDAEGDALTDLPPAPTAAQLAQLRAAPQAVAAALLAQASSRMVHDTSVVPPCTFMLRREQHALPAPAAPVRIRVECTYWDGTGRVLQKFEPAAASPAGAARWVRSAWAVHDREGRVLARYEPAHAEDLSFAFEQHGVPDLTLHDALGRPVAVVHADRSWEKVVHSAWGRASWDGNDTSAAGSPPDDPDVGALFAAIRRSACEPTWHELRTNPALAAQLQQMHPDPVVRGKQAEAAAKAAAHGRTPRVEHLDAQGRTIVRAIHATAVAVHETFCELDVLGRTRSITDPRGRTVARYVHDLVGQVVHQEGIDAGPRWLARDAAGEPLWQRDGRGLEQRIVHDPLRRPVRRILRDAGGQPWTVERRHYGESEPDGAARNLRTRVTLVEDQAGSVATVRRDFKGNVLRQERRVAAAYATRIDWEDGAAFEPLAYASMTWYDALDRPIQQAHPDARGVACRVLQHDYDPGGLLASVRAWTGRVDEPASWLDPAGGTVLLRSAEYNEKGQRLRVVLGNGAETRYEHDARTFRLARMVTSRGPHVLQDLRYARDAAGNTTSRRDLAQQDRFFLNQQVEASADYTFDALYRLVAATGREHLGQQGAAVPHRPRDAARCFMTGNAGAWSPAATGAFGRYSETYRYDDAGNLLEMAHRGGAAAPGWTRSFEYAEPSRIDPAAHSNGLTRALVGATVENHGSYDEHGCMLRMPQLAQMLWDHDDRLRYTRRQQLAGDPDAAGAAGEGCWYVYDAAGERVRKVTLRADGSVLRDRLYLGAVEILLRAGAQAASETLHAFDDKQRLALVEMGGGATPLVRYPLADPLGSTAAELDADGLLVSYEEYSPFGSTTYQAQRSATEAPKRYRYTGKERDDESGLYFHGARYYAPWLARWTSCDPVGVAADRVNLYEYVRNNPVEFRDPDGRFETGSFIDEVVQGGFHEGESTWAGTAANIAVGLIPIVGQAADIRDTAAAARDVYQDPTLEHAVGLTLSVIGFLPLLGDAIKGGGKAAMHAGKGLDTAAGKALSLPAGTAHNAQSSISAIRLRGQLAAQEIAGGHAFEKHVLNTGEFKGLDIRTRSQYSAHIEKVIAEPTAAKQLERGRGAYWHEPTGTVVITGPRGDGGSAFRPELKRQYFEQLK